jgi:RimJ/RimL family protein N-acetyltransferase
MNEVQLETDRLLLRMWREEDFEPYAKICEDADVMRYLGGKPFNRLEAWRQFAYLIGHWHLRGYGHWAVEEKATGSLVGRIGFLNPAGWPGFEIGWTLGRESWGKGYELDKDHVISLIHPENRASIRVAERLGEKPEGSAEVLGIPVIIYGVDRPAT